MGQIRELGLGRALKHYLPLLPVIFLGEPAFAAGPAASHSVSTASEDITAPVDLGEAGQFVILSKSGITDVPHSDVTGNVGTSPITGAADHLSCSEVTGSIYSVDASGPQPCSIKAPSKLTAAIHAMQTAYVDAAGRSATVTELGAGNIGGLTLKPGVYSWSTSVIIPTNVALKGGSHDIWIFQIANNLALSNGKAVLLQRHAKARNVFWQVGGKVTLGTTSHFEGNILSKTLIAMKTGASTNGRLLAQTAVTLQMNSIVSPQAAAKNP